ncbi:class I SAM-dependent methyltransferase [Myxococcus sp. MxC21-1]|uniref:SAM-dependent methyltransferase n=1 Tax=Myxococcus sp. MxC21-1 TaxID=3041439 RepID=UPI00292E734A|nr:class I SAM-dependent methyltransferase [Myxococcus sp. MxC21-1]WNZ62436.1 class I SAM-dependent methyltransferase [Myxococcus sp. MxC21-1]
MSGGALYQESLRALRRLGLPEVSERDVLAALEAAQPGPLSLFYEAGAEAGLPREALMARGAGLFLSFSAGNLADDLIDGECTYHDPPIRVGPCVQFILQNLAFATLCGAQAQLPGPVLEEAVRTLAVAAGPQALEVRASDWTAPLFRQVAEGIAGQQWAAYLRVLWAGTVLEPARRRRAGHWAWPRTWRRTSARGTCASPACPGRTVTRWWPGRAPPRRRCADWTCAAWTRRCAASNQCCQRGVMRAEAVQPEWRRDEVSAYYEAKTERLLQRYGPGPRVHYHSGLVDVVPPPGASSEVLRDTVHAAQEALLVELARAVGRFPDGGEVLDVGCGLGGGALYWATEHQAHVTAVTNVPSHVALVRGFAEAAGVSARVRPILCDALSVPGRAAFDAVVAVESACYLPRAEWFRRTRTLLKPAACWPSPTASSAARSWPPALTGIGARASARSMSTCPLRTPRGWSWRYATTCPHAWWASGR